MSLNKFLSISSLVKKVVLIIYDDNIRDGDLDGIDIIKNKLESIKDNIVRYAFIRHDKDIDDDGCLKKLHYHLYIEFGKSYHVSSLVKLFNLYTSSGDFNKITTQRVINSIGALQYLIHQNDKDKYQYDLKDVVTYNLNYREITQLQLDESQDEIKTLNHLIEFIKIGDNCDMVILTQYCITMGYLDILKKYYPIINNYINLFKNNKRYYLQREFIESIDQADNLED